MRGKSVQNAKSLIAGAAFLIPATLLAVSASAQVGQGAQAPAAAIVPDAEAGAELYSTECRGCHGVSIAPTLRGLLDRPIAGVPAFTGYSDGLKAKKDLTWTEVNLQAFLTSPAEFAPGTLMTKAISDPQARADIIAYIETLPPPR